MYNIALWVIKKTLICRINNYVVLRFKIIIIVINNSENFCWSIRLNH